MLLGSMRIARIDEGWARLSDDGAHLLDGAPWLGAEETGVVLSEYTLRAPVAPSKIVCVGRNYRAHAEELGNAVPERPLLFLKPPSALLRTHGVIDHPAASQRVDFEGEVGVVVGARARRISEADAERHVFGITCANDVTARDLQRADVQFTRGKGFDTFCPCGPWIETDPPPLDAITLRTRIDGELRQEGCTDRMLFGIPTLLAYISEIMTLEPGDLILTGTPEGVGPLRPGQVVDVTIDGVGTLSNPFGESVVP